VLLQSFVQLCFDRCYGRLEPAVLLRRCARPFIPYPLSRREVSSTSFSVLLNFFSQFIGHSATALLITSFCGCLLEGGGNDKCCDWWLRWFTMSHLPPGYRVLSGWSCGSWRTALVGRRAPVIDPMCHCKFGWGRWGG
jgi:hypothetical protein